MPSRNGKTQQDAIALLTSDHETVRDLLAQMDDTTSRAAKKRVELMTKIAREVRIHSRIEEEIFYPAYKDAAKTQEDRKLFFEAQEEHGIVDLVLPALEEADPASDEFAAKAKVLKDLIEHHADEEEDEMFPRAKKLLGKDRLTELGEELRMRKEELQTEMGGERAGRGSRSRESASR
jgi:hemerythrin-like domain-containing protein